MLNESPTYDSIYRLTPRKLTTPGNEKSQRQTNASTSYVPQKLIETSKILNKTIAPKKTENLKSFRVNVAEVK